MRRFFSRGTSNDSSPQTPPTASSPTPLFSPSTAVASGPARPIRLVYCDERGKFQMDPEAVSVLQLVKEPVGVVSVCGRARQGKSYILNQLLGRSSGFQVASTHRPCTKGLWLWSTPLRRTALDGTEYNLLLIDSEGIDAYDQTGTYSTQIFSLAVLLSSMFIYNQMGGIDEAALDRLSLVTEMTKHIRVRASGGKTTASELGQFSPIFVWLLRDFYLDLVEDNRKITPRDYLELALRPVQGGGRDVSAKNEIRESIRALFPDRDCFTLVRPLSNENELQRLDQISMDKLRPEFKSGLDELTRFVFERTRPKQLGATVMTGPIFAGITQSFLDALNNGAVPTITSSWQSVEETECQRALEYATEVYKSSFDRTRPPEEAAIQEAHEEAAQKAVAAFNSTAVGAGSVRQRCEKRLHTFLRKEFEDYKREAFMKAYMQCSNAIQKMEKELRTACQAPAAKFSDILKALDQLLNSYEASSYGPEKWQKLASFLRQSLEGPILDFVKKQIDHIATEKSSLQLKCRSIEDKMRLFTKQLEASEKYKSNYIKRYEDAINDKNKLAEEYMSRIADIKKNSSSLDERCSSLSRTLEAAKQESVEWKRKYELALSNQKTGEEQASSEVANLKARSSAAEARLAAAREQTMSAQEEADEWKRKYDVAVREAKNALEKAAAVQDRASKQTHHREDALRAEFAGTLAGKEAEIKDKASKIEQAEQRVTTLSLELKAAESKIKSYDLEISALKSDIKELGERLESANATAQSYEREARILEQERVHLEQKYRSEFDRFEEIQERCRNAEKETKRASELADIARVEAVTAQKEKNEIQRLAGERLTEITRLERRIESLDRRKEDLADELERYQAAEMDAISKVRLLEARVEEREKEIETLLKSNNEQRASTVQVLESLLETERAARAEATNRAEALSVQLQATQGKLDLLQQQMTTVRLNESALDSKLRTTSHGKRYRVEDNEMGTDSVQELYDDRDRVIRGNKRSRSTTSPLKFVANEDGGSVFRGNEDDSNHSQQTSSEDHTKFTILKLKQELTKHNFGAELLQLKNPNKKDLVALYEKCVLQKS
ncbi:guanylate-binding protein 1-like isoform X1 [Cynara cardunculus var. scolymus]|uniref:guanylate-binding protein 1-like isoform X1 n=1 Tax=Cynara cardunculus var. scolymus TaxID=59895 RepID=UPI000D62497D|nr:guanylate-binding protein 1-like isoform X1 [Cynara cardunculus var. scolymus]